MPDVPEQINRRPRIMKEKTAIIIGAGLAGLATGI
jgi:cation diffusion facilitator CzcD-associated flavoprotein CzcO